MSEKGKIAHREETGGLGKSVSGSRGCMEASSRCVLDILKELLIEEVL